MPRERSGISYSDLAEAPGAIPKPRAKRDKSKARQQHNSTLVSYTMLKAVNPERAAEARAEDFGAQSRACERLPCFRCARKDCSVAHHEPPRSRGGTDLDTIPLCDRTKMRGNPGCHQLRHDRGETTFWEELRVTPDEAKEHVRLQAASGAGSDEMTGNCRRNSHRP